MALPHKRVALWVYCAMGLFRHAFVPPCICCTGRLKQITRNRLYNIF